MYKIFLAAAGAAVVLGLIGCTEKIVPEPASVTFENAMEQVTVGLNKMYDTGKGYPKTGLVPAEVTIEFNVGASAADSGKLTIGTANPIQNVQAGGEISSNIQASRGNKITIKFVNLFLTDSKESLIMLKQPEEIAELLKVLKSAGYEPIYKMFDGVEK